MSPFTQAAFTLVVLVLFFLHLRELRALRSAVGSLAARVLPVAPAPVPSTSAPSSARPATRSEPEPILDRDSTDALTQVMQGPLAAPAAPAIDPAEPPRKAAQAAASLSRPRSQRTGAPPHDPPPPPVKIAPSDSTAKPATIPPSRPLPPVIPPPRPIAGPRTGTLPSMPAQVLPDADRAPRAREIATVCPACDRGLVVLPGGLRAACEACGGSGFIAAQKDG